MPAKDKIEIQNINCPGQNNNVDAEKYHVMRNVLLKVVPKKLLGLTQAKMQKAILPHLPDHLWPGGAKTAWWAKTVQLDLEAKGLLVRTNSKPLTWYKS